MADVEGAPLEDVSLSVHDDVELAPEESEVAATDAAADTAPAEREAETEPTNRVQDTHDTESVHSAGEKENTAAELEDSAAGVAADDAVDDAAAIDAAAGVEEAAVGVAGDGEDAAAGEEVGGSVSGDETEEAVSVPARTSWHAGVMPTGAVAEALRAWGSHFRNVMMRGFPTLSGHLFKKGGASLGLTLFKQWKKRYLNFSDATLHYYKDVRGKRTLRGAIPLAGATVTRVRRDNIPSPFVFEVVGGNGRAEVLVAESEEVLREWMTAVLSVVYLLSGKVDAVEKSMGARAPPPRYDAAFVPSSLGGAAAGGAPAVAVAAAAGPAAEQSCSNCGNALPQRANFCDQCGTRVV